MSWSSQSASGADPSAARLDGDPVGPTLPHSTPALPANASDPLIGTTLGTFRVTRLLGRGGMGSVYLGEHPGIGSRVAIKVIHPEWSADAGVVQRFITEARAANLIQHPAIVRIFDLGRTNDGRLYLLMEFLDGEPLSSLIAGPMPVETRIELLAQLCDALGAAHTHGVVHRDLKPDNVFVTATPAGGQQVKVLDFGIAKLTASGGVPGLTMAGQLVGSPEYMAPEQWDSGPIDPRTDVYALGVLAYHVLTGRLPFEGPNLAQLLMAHHRDVAVPPSELRPELPRAASDAVMRALAKKPEDRFQTMGDFRAALLGALVSLHAPAQLPAADAFAPTLVPATRSRTPVTSNAPAAPPLAYVPLVPSAADELAARPPPTPAPATAPPVMRTPSEQFARPATPIPAASPPVSKTPSGQWIAQPPTPAPASAPPTPQAVLVPPVAPAEPEPTEAGQTPAPPISRPATPSARPVPAAALSPHVTPAVAKPGEQPSTPVSWRPPGGIAARVEGTDGRFLGAARCMEIAPGGLLIAPIGFSVAPFSKVRLWLELQRGKWVRCDGQITARYAGKQLGVLGVPEALVVQLPSAPRELELELDTKLGRRRATPVPHAKPHAQAADVLSGEVEVFRKRLSGDHYHLLTANPDLDSATLRHRAELVRREAEHMGERHLTARERELLDTVIERAADAMHIFSDPARRAAYDASRRNFRGVARCLAEGLAVTQLEPVRRRFLDEHPHADVAAANLAKDASALEARGQTAQALERLEAALQADPLNLDLHQRYWTLRRAQLRKRPAG